MTRPCLQAPPSPATSAARPRQTPCWWLHLPRRASPTPTPWPATPTACWPCPRAALTGSSTSRPGCMAAGCMTRARTAPPVAAAATAWQTAPPGNGAIARPCAWPTGAPALSTVLVNLCCGPACRPRPMPMTRQWAPAQGKSAACWASPSAATAWASRPPLRPCVPMRAAGWCPLQMACACCLTLTPHRWPATAMPWARLPGWMPCSCATWAMCPRPWKCATPTPARPRGVRPAQPQAFPAPAAPSPGASAPCNCRVCSATARPCARPQNG